MTASFLGRTNWSLDRDDEGHRTYTLESRVKTNSVSDGPLTIAFCSGLPAVGDYWNFGSDTDVWAFCTPAMKVTLDQHKEGEPHRHWKVSQTFTTKPLKRCQDSTIEDPLLEPPNLSGSFTKFTREVYRDRFGNYIKSSSHELFKGPQVEFDQSRLSVKVSMNVADLDLDLIASLMDNVNSGVMWGLGPRKVRFSNFSWDREVYGTCSYYFKQDMEFEVDWRQEWDRLILDEGTKVLNGDWDRASGNYQIKRIATSGALPSSANPQHFVRYKDRNGENTRVILNGSGLPANTTLISGTGTGTTVSGGPAQLRVEYYPQNDLFLLGVPVSLL